MKRERIIILLIAIILVVTFFIRAENSNSIITGDTVTGEITNVLALNLTVSGPPQLSILHPRNQTYFASQNLILNFTVDDENWIKYSLDNADNVTITGNIKFNTTEGSHTLFLYANNSAGESSKNVTFFVNSTKFMIKYNNYSNGNGGNTTNFNAFSFEDAQNITGVILENMEKGKINFNDGVINLTDDANFSDGEIDVDSYTNISFNRIEINSAALPNFNKSATLSFYNLTFTNPRVLRGGELCSSAICTEQNYSDGTFVFNVTGFSVYTTEETPSSSTDSGGQQQTGGGGSSGGSALSKIIPAKRGISVSEEDIKISLKQGQVTTKTLVVTNNDIKKLRINIENPRLKDFVIVREPVFDLSPGESKEVTLDLIAREKTKPDLYLGSLLVKSEYEEKQIFVAIEVQTSNALLDVRVEIHEDSKKIIPGENLVSEIRLFNFGIIQRADVVIDYILKDYFGNEVPLSSESLAIETQASFVSNLAIPEDAKYGKYVLYVRASYNDQVASASDNFEIVEFKVSSREKIFIVAIIFIMIAVSMIMYLSISKKEKNSSDVKRKIKIGDLVNR